MLDYLVLIQRWVYLLLLVPIDWKSISGILAVFGLFQKWHPNSRLCLLPAFQPKNHKIQHNLCCISQCEFFTSSSCCRSWRESCCRYSPVWFESSFSRRDADDTNWERFRRRSSLSSFGLAIAWLIRNSIWSYIEVQGHEIWVLDHTLDLLPVQAYWSTKSYFFANCHALLPTAWHDTDQGQIWVDLEQLYRDMNPNLRNQPVVHGWPFLASF